MKKYLNCPTCGGLCFYPSSNWEEANQPISAASYKDLLTEIDILRETVKDREEFIIGLLKGADLKSFLKFFDNSTLFKELTNRARGFQSITWSDLHEKIS